MITRRLVLGLIAALALAAGVGTKPMPVAAAEPTAFVTDLADRAITRLTSKELNQAARSAEFRKLLVTNFDVPAIGRFVLGRYWREANEAQRAEYMKLFEDLLVITYGNRFAEYGGEKLKVQQARDLGNDEMLVGSEVIRPVGAPVKVDWRIRKSGDNLKIIDVIIEGVSMAVTQRDDYAAAIQRGGGKIDALLASLRDKVRAAGGA